MKTDEVMPIINQNVQEILEKYLTGKLLFTIQHEIVNAIGYDLAQAEAKKINDREDDG